MPQAGIEPRLQVNVYLNLIHALTHSATTAGLNQTLIIPDSLQSSHPISVPVNHPDEINEIFDSISYGKGASVIRMMANFLGLETFNGGITNYLNKHEYGNAKQVCDSHLEYKDTACLHYKAT